ncbi:hypothetical protein BH09BAC5_BH09BAC5_26820 [soil metagenome]
MKNHPLTPEQKADLALESLERIQQSELPEGFDEKMFARFDSEFTKAKTPKWFWIAASVILMVNLFAAYNSTVSASASTSDVKTDNSNSINNVSTYYFQGGTDWYN